MRLSQRSDTAALNPQLWRIGPKRMAKSPKSLGELPRNRGNGLGRNHRRFEPRYARSSLDPWGDWVIERWNGGQRNGRRMLRELRGMGFSGNYATVLRYLNRLRAAQEGAAPPRRPRARPGPPLVAAPKRVLTPRTAAWAVLRRPERRSAEDRALLAELLGRSPGLDAAVALAEGFATLARGRRPELLDPWLKAAQDVPVAGLRRFAKRLLADEGAVRAAVTLGWSNGQTEGQINRLKMLKRQMFGRAGLDLIERRFLLAA